MSDADDQRMSALTARKDVEIWRPKLGEIIVRVRALVITVSGITVLGMAAGVAAKNGGEPMLGVMPSFNCDKASDQNEVMICSHPKLAAMDAGIERLYRTALATNPAVRVDQRKWVSERDACSDVACLISTHEDRFEQLLWQSKAASTFKAPAITGTLKIISLSPGVYGFAARAFWRSSGGSVHDGSSAGVFRLINSQAITTDSAACELTLTKLQTGSWSIVQGESCQQGFNVTLTGVYRAATAPH